MSTSPTGERHNGSANTDAFDDKMHQIRELLFGESKRESDARIALIEGRIREVEQSLHRRLDAIQSSIEALTRDLASERKRSIDQLAASIGELGDKVRRIGTD